MASRKMAEESKTKTIYSLCRSEGTVSKSIRRSGLHLVFYLVTFDWLVGFAVLM
jgi:hypothetical protein